MQTDQGHIVIALSGGVDSAVAAARLMEEGRQVRGVHLRLTDKRRDASGVEALCRFLGIEFVEVDVRRQFRVQVIDYFAEQYRAGKTPNPCVRCNERIKFGELFRLIRSWGCRYLATGHYARIGPDAAGVPAMYRGADPDKEQSYFLHRLPVEVLNSVVFPLGEWTKSRVKEKSASLGLDRFLAAGESQELCFVDGDYRDLIRALGKGGPGGAGPMVNRRGEIVGRHRGLEHYTIGQRQGLGVPAAAPYYVLEMVPEANQLVVGGKEELLAGAFEVAEVNWLVRAPAAPLAVQVRLRYRHPGAFGVVVPAGANRVRVLLDVPQSAITPGQAAVFYRGEQVLGGGWIVGAVKP